MINHYPCTKCGTIYSTVLGHVCPPKENIASALDIQLGGDHYKTKAIQPWEYITANNLDFFAGNIIKYITRYKDKNGLEDLKKARHYIDYIIEQEEKRIK